MKWANSQFLILSMDFLLFVSVLKRSKCYQTCLKTALLQMKSCCKACDTS